MAKQKIKNKFLWVFLFFLTLMTIFILVYQYYYPQKEELYYQRNTLGNKVYFEDEALIYTYNSDEFVGYKFKSKPLKNYKVTMPSDILVSKKEYPSYFEQTKSIYNMNTEYQNNNLHIQIGETGKSFTNPSYHMLLSVYNDGYYIQSVIYFLEEDIDIENKEETISHAKMYCDKLLSHYNENKNDIKNILKDAESRDFGK